MPPVTSALHVGHLEPDMLMPLFRNHRRNFLVNATAVVIVTALIAIDRGRRFRKNRAPTSRAVGQNGPSLFHALVVAAGFSQLEGSATGEPRSSRDRACSQSSVSNRR